MNQTNKYFLCHTLHQIRFYTCLKLIHKSFVSVFSQFLSWLIQRIFDYLQDQVHLENILFFKTILHASIVYVELIWFSSTEHGLLVNIPLLSILPSIGEHLVCLNPFYVPSHAVYFILCFCFENKLLKSLILNASLYNLPLHFTNFEHTHLPRRLETRESLLQAKEE